MNRLSSLVALSLTFLLAAGCEPQARNVGGEATPTPTPAPTATPAAPVAPTKPAEDPYIVGKRTQDIRPAAPEQQKGAQVSATKITAKDPITLQGNAYVTIVGKNSILQIQHALDLYQAETGAYPKDYPEFMEKIIKANNIALPQLPYYQKYGYNEQEHKLIVLEYPRDQPPQP